MKPVAAVYDVHGNLPALEAVLEDIRRAGVGQIVVGGDLAPGPMPVETLTRLLELDIPVYFISGNGEAELLAILAGGDTGNIPERFREAVTWAAGQLQPEYRELLAGWPKTLQMEVEGLGEVLFCHATPRSDTEVITRLTPAERLTPVFEGVSAGLVVCGHTHMQFDRTVGRVRVVNAGSVGMSYGGPGACWLLLGPEVQLRHTPYDYARAAERIRGTRYQQADEFAWIVLNPPAESEVLAAFRGMEIR